MPTVCIYLPPFRIHQLHMIDSKTYGCHADTLRPIQVLQGSAHLCLAHTPNGEQDWASQHIAEAIGSFRAAAHRAAPSAAGSSSVAEDVAAASLKLAFLCNHLLQVLNPLYEHPTRLLLHTCHNQAVHSEHSE